MRGRTAILQALLFSFLFPGASIGQGGMGQITDKSRTDTVITITMKPLCTGENPKPYKLVELFDVKPGKDDKVSIDGFTSTEGHVGELGINDKKDGITISPGDKGETDIEIKLHVQMKAGGSYDRNVKIHVKVDQYPNNQQAGVQGGGDTPQAPILGKQTMGSREYRLYLCPTKDTKPSLIPIPKGETLDKNSIVNGNPAIAEGTAAAGGVEVKSKAEGTTSIQFKTDKMNYTVVVKKWDDPNAPPRVAKKEDEKKKDKEAKNAFEPPRDFKTESGAFVAAENRLPAGTFYTSAVVLPGTMMEFKEEAVVLEATGTVMSARAVHPNERVTADNVSSVLFRNGKGLTIDVAAKAAAGLIVTTGGASLLSQNHKSGLPVYGGSTSVFVGNDKPFANSALMIQGQQKKPDLTHVEFFNPAGQKTGECATFGNLPKNLKDAQVAVVDDKGVVVSSAKVQGGVLQGTPVIKLNQGVYQQNQPGTVDLMNLDGFQKLAQMTQFGCASGFAGRMITLKGENTVGLPAQVPFPTTKVPFRAGQPGKVGILATMPGGPPSSDARAAWISQFQPK